MKNVFTLAILATLVAACSKAPQDAGAARVQTVSTVATSGEQLCQRDIAKHVQFKDPDSIRINSIKASGHTVEHYDMLVSAKNSYGGYGAPMQCQCIAEPAHDRLRYMFCGEPK